MYDPVRELREKHARILAEAKEREAKELEEYPLSAYSMRALKDEIKRRKGKRA